MTASEGPPWPHVSHLKPLQTAPTIEVATITRLSDYSGERLVRLAATQLGNAYSASAARKVVTEWVEYFSSGPSPIEELHLVTRTPRRLFTALQGQSQLTGLRIKWGDYEELGILSDMHDLKELRLGGASKVTDLGPLSELQRVERLLIESLRLADDLAPLGAMRSVVDLELGGNWISSRVAHFKSASFLRNIPQLQRLVFHTMAIDDLDYTPILELPHLQSVRVMKARGMRPAHERLIASTPWSS
ncbi:hypothetical protein [Kineococcus sp. R86509]|uniref:hypothetical protein n=1 Tax=Kineococcus sp. R86509 TaxID=3093851 RepID=UPI0036D20BFE